jgi:hypothetical protein
MHPGGKLFVRFPGRKLAALAQPERADKHPRILNGH